MLLQAWNRAFYRYYRFDEKHFSDIQNLLDSNEEYLMSIRGRAIEQYGAQDEAEVQALFGAFEKILGPVGAAKCLHLVAPSFFPLWDRAIAAAYGIQLGPKGTNGNGYCRFMESARDQCKGMGMGGNDPLNGNPLKLLDEYNYCKYTKRWT